MRSTDGWPCSRFWRGQRICCTGPRAGLRYAAEAVYPWYILHQSLIVLAAYWLVPFGLGPVWEPLLVLGLTVIGCLLIHELLIRRIGWLRPLFGLAARSPRSVRGNASAPDTRDRSTHQRSENVASS